MKMVGSKPKERGVHIYAGSLFYIFHFFPKIVDLKLEKPNGFVGI